MARTPDHPAQPPANEDARRAARAEGGVKPRGGNAGGTYGQKDAGGRGNQGAVKGKTEADRA